MKKTPYTNRKGEKQFKPVLSLRSFEQHVEDNTGFCLACGAEIEGLEPDARKCTCPECHAPKAFGLEELLLMNLIKIKQTA